MYFYLPLFSGAVVVFGGPAHLRELLLRLSQLPPQLPAPTAATNSIKVVGGAEEESAEKQREAFLRETCAEARPVLEAPNSS